MQYSLDGTSYDTTIPTATDAGTYTVYYKVIGGDNYNDVEAASIEVTIPIKEMVTTGSAEVTIDAEVEQQLLDELFTEEEIAQNVEMKVTVKVDVVEVTDMDESTQKEFTSYLDAYQADLDDDPTTITIETDRFSNYTLNYVDVVDVETDDTDVDVDNDTVTTVADTGDDSSIHMFMMLMFISVLGILVGSKKKLVK